MTKICKTGLIAATACTLAASPAMAQQSGDAYVKLGVARTKLVDKGDIFTNGVLDPNGGYTTRASVHGQLTGGFFLTNGIALEGSISTPATTDNVPAGSLAGLPNLGSDEFVLLTAGATLQPIKGRLSPYVGAGLQYQWTRQQRDGLGVNLNVEDTHGPYVKGGVDFALTERLGVFAEARKAWYNTNATGRLPLDATYTVFADVAADAQLDPLTLQAGVTARFGKRLAGSSPIADEAADTRWIVRGGISHLELADKAEIAVAGAPLAGEGISTFEHSTVSLQIAYKLAPQIAVNATLGLPPTIDVYGAGTIGGLPKLGEVTYGPTALTLQYHLTNRGVFRPYVGAGLSYMIVFGTKDGAFGDLEVGNDLGPVVEAGTDVMVSNRASLFFDVKKAQLRPAVTGTFMGAPVNAKATLDPWVFSAGYAYRF